MAGFNVSNFKANGLIYGGARPTLFKVELTFPRTSIPQAEFFIKSASLPPSIINPVPVGYFGRNIKLAGDRDFQPWEVMVLNDEDFLIRSAFEEWHNSINTLVSNRLDPDVSSVRSTGLGNSYKTVATVHQYGKTGPGDESGIIRSYKFDGIFPVSIGPIMLDWEATNQIEQFDVTFEFDWYEPIRGNGNGVEAIDFNSELSPA